MSSFWYLITALAILAAIINFSIAVVRRKQPLVALVRALAGLVSLAAAIGVVVGKAIQFHPSSALGFSLQWQMVILATGVFIFIVLLAPSWVGRDSSQPEPTLQERAKQAARPVNATVRLREQGADEWVN